MTSILNASRDPRISFLTLWKVKGLAAQETLSLNVPSPSIEHYILFMRRVCVGEAACVREKEEASNRDAEEARLLLCEPGEGLGSGKFF